MHLPDREFAEVAPRKVSEYLLNPRHPIGGGKAKFFLAHGFSGERPRELVTALLRLVQDHEVSSISEAEHGRKYVVDGALATPMGHSVHVRTVWAIDSGRLNPRFVTAHPRPRSKP